MKHELEFWISKDRENEDVDVWSARPHWDSEFGWWHARDADFDTGRSVADMCDLLDIEVDELVNPGECKRITVKATVEVSE